MVAGQLGELDVRRARVGGAGEIQGDSSLRRLNGRQLLSFHQTPPDQLGRLFANDIPMDKQDSGQTSGHKWPRAGRVTSGPGCQLPVARAAATRHGEPASFKGARRQEQQ